MALGRPKPPLELSVEDREQLECLASSRSLAHGLVMRAQIILLSHTGLTNTAVAEQLGIGQDTVRKWRSRFIARGIQGLHDELRSGRPRSIDDERVAELVNKTLQTTPTNGTHWSCRALANETSVSKSTAHRIWQAFRLQPHRQKGFKLSTDPFFVEKVRDIVGLYLDPPDKAVVLCVDEKSQIQALDRTQPMLPMGLGYVEGLTHDYKRHGTTTLFAAIELAEGRLIGTCMPRHRHQEWIRFLKLIDQQTPPELDLHLIVDNYATHKHAQVKKWLKRHRRFHVHFTPTSSSWLNLIERWFRDLTDKRIRRGVFRSVEELVTALMDYVAQHNEHPQSFTWTAKVEDILEKVRRARAVLDKISSE